LEIGIWRITEQYGKVSCYIKGWRPLFLVLLNFFTLNRQYLDTWYYTEFFLMTQVM
jgi:hypothetical protein